MNILVREEEKKEYRRVEEITREAFSYPGRIERGGIGCPYEHWMVNELRRRDGILSLSLVAVEQSDEKEKLIGHIICSKAEVRTEKTRLRSNFVFWTTGVLPAIRISGSI